MSPRDISFCQKSTRALGMFMGYKEESSLEISVFVTIKVRDPFLQIQKKIGPTVNLEAKRQKPHWPSLVVMGKKPYPQKEGSFLEREGKWC